MNGSHPGARRPEGAEPPDPPTPPTPPRTILVTGAGGAGRTTVAAATALAAAREGLRALLVTAEQPAPLTGLLGTAVPAGAEPTAVAFGLWAARVDAAGAFRERALDWQRHGGGLFGLLGARPFEGIELTELPGAAEFALLSAVVTAHRRSGAEGWDLVVVDAPPTPETVRLIGLPEQLRRYLRRLLPPERQAARALHPLLGRLAGVPIPAPGLFDTAARWDAELAAVERALAAGSTTARLVLPPGPRALHALDTARAGLALHGMEVDAVVANRLLPRDSPDPFTAGLAARQHSAVREARHRYLHTGVTLCQLPHLGREPESPADLATLVDRATSAGVDGGPPAQATVGVRAGAGLVDEVRGWSDGGARDPWTVRDRLAEDGLLEWRLPLPGAVREDVDLVRRGDELIVTVGPHRRVMPLPSALRRCSVQGAGLAERVLSVRFVPDPDRWPRPTAPRE